MLTPGETSAEVPTTPVSYEARTDIVLSAHSAANEGITELTTDTGKLVDKVMVQNTERGGSVFFGDTDVITTAKNASEVDTILEDDEEDPAAFASLTAEQKAAFMVASRTAVVTEPENSALSEEEIKAKTLKMTSSKSAITTFIDWMKKFGKKTAMY